MIKLESIHIEEFRGIRKLDVEFQRESFAISGPNGSGKSGVIDAIEFGLTGQIGRLAGRGTQGLSIAEHGPHVDMTKFPDAAFVRLRVFLTALGKSVTVTRKVSDPKKPQIEPANDDVRAGLTEIADHPEITLSRREILRFILVEPTKRSEEIQTLLKLNEIGEWRRAFNTAQNRLQTEQGRLTDQVTSRETALKLHLQATSIVEDAVLAAVNSKRKLLALQELTELKPDTSLVVGLAASVQASTFNKSSALKDLTAFEVVAKSFTSLGDAELAQVAAGIATLEADPALFTALQRLTFIERGLTFVEEPACPLCDAVWENIELLRTHLRTKVEKSTAAQATQKMLLDSGAKLAAHAATVLEHLGRLHAIAAAQHDEEIAKTIAAAQAKLDQLKARLGSVEGIVALKERLVRGFLVPPQDAADAIRALTEKTMATPDQTATVDAQTFLSTAQVRLNDYREARRNSDAALVAFNAAKHSHDIYCAVMEAELNTLYDAVQQDFSTYYRAINEDDESRFTAKFSPTEGKLDLTVNFYERGLFPPGAYHSEGHQDGMGVCLYLALMKRLQGEDFTFALLDDVVMSVDSGHRKQFCKLLKTQFPNTQFVITTHDRLWAEQMRSAGLVTRKTSLVFHGWNVNDGPLVASNDEVWDEIAGDLAKNNVNAAAAALRNHLEFISRELADRLGAYVHFRGDGTYEMGDLLPATVGRLRELYGKAAAAAQSWQNEEAKTAAGAAKDDLSQASAASNVEQWAINKAVHHNEWATFSKADFAPVIETFKELLNRFRCQKCGSWLHITGRPEPESLRCDCTALNFNLKGK